MPPGMTICPVASITCLAESADSAPGAAIAAIVSPATATSQRTTPSGVTTSPPRIMRSNMSAPGRRQSRDTWLAQETCARRRAELPLRAADDLHQLFNLSALIGLVAGGDCAFHAMGEVVAQDFLLHSPQRGANRRNLRHDVDAIAVRFNHARDPAHLAFDPVQSLGAGRLDVFPHARYIPPYGIDFNC